MYRRDSGHWHCAHNVCLRVSRQGRGSRLLTLVRCGSATCGGGWQRGTVDRRPGSRRVSRALASVCRASVWALALLLRMVLVPDPAPGGVVVKFAFTVNQLLS